jgi:hypothetical protein
MRKSCSVLTLLVISCGAWGQPQKSDASDNTKRSAESRVRASPEMGRLLNAFVGKWVVKETFEVSASKQGRTREGTATFRAGPGFSLIEEYRSNGSAGDLRFLALLWWDPKSQVYPLLTCANNDGCRLRGTARWEGMNLVNTWEEEIEGKKISFKDSFVDISPSSFTLVSEGLGDGTAVWRVTTKYTKQTTKQPANKQ